VTIIVLGASGMLGSTIYNYLKTDENLNVFGTSSRSNGNLFSFNVLNDSVEKLVQDLEPTHIVNCIGKIKPEIDESSPKSIQDAIAVNSVFPIKLSRVKPNLKIIQIATDCVFDGKDSNYLETSLHNATDVYGKTKSLGEISAKNFINLRCSIIGRELEKKKSLLEWVLSHPKGGGISGFTNHKWNGVTTLAFAKVVSGIIKSKDSLFTEGRFHLVPGNSVSKYQLIEEIISQFQRDDLKISPVESSMTINRTLATLNGDINNSLWRNAGYNVPPSIEEMLNEYSIWLNSSSNAPT